MGPFYEGSRSTQRLGGGVAQRTAAVGAGGGDQGPALGAQQGARTGKVDAGRPANLAVEHAAGSAADEARRLGVEQRRR